MMNNYKRLLGFSLLVASMNAQSMISPAEVNLRDLKIMTQFIAKHQKVADTLERIEFLSHTLVFDNGCKAYFVRPKPSIFPFSGPGSQAPIEFKSSSCSLTYGNKVQGNDLKK